MKKFAAAAAFATLVLPACSKKEPGWTKHVFVEHDLSREAVQARLPRGLWSKLTAVLHPDKKPAVAESHDESEEGGEAGEAGEALEATGPLPSVFVPIKVYMIEKNKGILRKGNTQIDYAAGGGNLDLSEFVQSKNGSFYFAVDFLPDVADVEKKVYFLSNGAERKSSHETLGAGCNSYYDISKAFDRAMKRDGFLINTRDGRHVSALAGTYFFAAAKDGRIFLAALTIKDSMFKKLLCRF